MIRGLVVALLFSVIVTMGGGEQTTSTPPATVWTPVFTMYGADSQSVNAGGTITCKEHSCPIWLDATATTWTHSDDVMGPYGMDGFRVDFSNIDTDTYTIKGRSTRKDLTKGPFGAYLFETVGTHTVTLLLDDGKGNGDSTDTATATVIVSATDQSKVECFSIGGTFASPACDSPATQTTVAASACNTVMAACSSDAGECLALAERGDTYTGCSARSINAGGAARGIGAHGSGAQPIFDYGSSFTGSGIQVNGVDVGFTLMDVELRGRGTEMETTTAAVVAISGQSSPASGFAAVRVTITPGTWQAGFSNNFFISALERVLLWEVDFTDMGLALPGSESIGGIGVFVGANLISFVGSTLTDMVTGSLVGSHVVRIMTCSRCSFRHSTIGGAGGATGADFTTRARHGVATEFLYLQDNLIRLSGNEGFNFGHNANGTSDTHVRYVGMIDNWFERYSGLTAFTLNFCLEILMGTQGAPSNNSSVSDVLVARNLCDARLASGWNTSGGPRLLRYSQFSEAESCDGSPSWPCDSYVLIGNIILGDESGRNYSVGSGAFGADMTKGDCLNNVVYASAGTETPCASTWVNAGGNVSSGGTDPFNLVAGEPTDWPSVKITTGSALAGSAVNPNGLTPPYSVFEDGFQGAFPQGVAPDSGVHEIVE